VIVAVQVGCIAASFAVEYLKFDWSVSRQGSVVVFFSLGSTVSGRCAPGFCEKADSHSGWLVATYATNPAAISQTVLAQCARAVATLNACIVCWVAFKLQQSERVVVHLAVS
jgi:hypothetical protein